MTDRCRSLKQRVLLKSLKLVQNQIREYHCNPTTQEDFDDWTNVLQIHKG